MIPLGEARELIVSVCPVLPAESRPLAAALRCVTAEPIVAHEDVPSFPNSAMDGFAVRSADVAEAPARLRVADSVMAGDGRPVSVGPGQAVRIMTGAVLPDGADAVCMVERTQTESDGQWVVIEQAVPAGLFVRRPGSDIAAGSEVVAAGTQFSAAHLGVLSRLGVDTVRVHRPPTVGVLSTGDELTEDPGPLRRGDDPRRQPARPARAGGGGRLPGGRPRHRPRRSRGAPQGDRGRRVSTATRWSRAVG